MQRRRKTCLSLGVLLTVAGVCMLWGCTSTDQQATAEDVNNKAFTFTSGAVFHPALANTATSLEFTTNASTFTLSSTGGTAMGNNHFGSCVLTMTFSTYTPGTGPQVNDVITLSPCDYNSTSFTLTVSNGPNTATSNPAVTRLVDATAHDVNNKSFLFLNGGVFHTSLLNVSTTLEYTNNAATFMLIATSGTATGVSTFGPCTLTVTSSTYKINTGPQVNDVITLSLCEFNSASGTLTVSNGLIIVSSI